jgi:hypothetical protein
VHNDLKPMRMSKREIPATPRTPNQQLLIGLAMATVGILIVALAAGIIPAPEKSFHAPHLVVGLAGMLFVLAGAIFLTPLLIAGFVPSNQYTPRQKRAIKLAQQIFGCLLLTSFAAVPLWIGFGPGERTFNSSIGSSGLMSHAPGDAMIGRMVFGAAGIFVGIWAMYTWIGLLRAVMARFRRSDDDGAM